MENTAIKIFGAFVFFAIVTVAIYEKGYNDAKHKMELASAKVEVVAHENHEAQQQQSEVKAAELVEQQQATQVIYKTIERRIPYAVTQYIERPGAPVQAVPECIYTRAFVRVWNDANTATVSDAARVDADPPASADPVAAESAGLERENIDSADILRNHVDNAEQCTGIRQYLNALLDWHQQFDQQGSTHL